MKEINTFSPRRKWAVKPSHIALHLVLTVFALFCLMPMILVLTSSFEHEKDIFVSGYSYFPAGGYTIDAYKMVFQNAAQLLRSFFVTGTVTVVGTVLGLCLTLPLGYILTRKDFQYRKIVAFYVFFTMIFSGGLVPTYLMISGWFKLSDNYIVLLLPYLCTGFNVLMAKGMMQSIPESLIESAKIDGAGELKTFLRIIIPISKPAVATVGLFIAISYWNDWMTSYLYISNTKLYSLQYLLVQIQQNISFLSSLAANYLGLHNANAPLYTSRMAMCVLITLPILCVYPFIQKYFEKGITIGSVKG